MEQKRPWRPRREAPCAGATRDAWDGADSSASERLAGGAGTAARRGCQRRGGSGSAAASALCLSVLLAGAWAQNTTEQMPYYAPMDYAVVGQAKSGTSSLWAQLQLNPLIKWVGAQKESFFFNTERGDFGRCDNSIEELQRLTSIQRYRFNRTDVLMGDWTATHFTCQCCAPVLKMLNPKMKIVIIFREPVQRSLSRFVEQKRQPHFPFHKAVVNHTFGSYVDVEVGSLQACLARAAMYKRYSPPAAEGAGAAANTQQPAGWGAGLDIATLMEMQCYQRHNIFGWSVYDKHLENYMAHFPPSQLLVLYTDDLAAQPLETLRKVEAFLGVPPHPYSNHVISRVWNSRECYHWRCERKMSDMRPLEVLAGGSGHMDGPFAMAVAKLRAFFRPSVQRLIAWADAGRIPPVPTAWRTLYA